MSGSPAPENDEPLSPFRKWVMIGAACVGLLAGLTGIRDPERRWTLLGQETDLARLDTQCAADLDRLSRMAEPGMVFVNRFRILGSAGDGACFDLRGFCDPLAEPPAPRSGLFDKQDSVACMVADIIGNMPAVDRPGDWRMVPWTSRGELPD